MVFDRFWGEFLVYGGFWGLLFVILRKLLKGIAVVGEPQSFLWFNFLLSTFFWFIFIAGVK